MEVVKDEEVKNEALETIADDSKKITQEIIDSTQEGLDALRKKNRAKVYGIEVKTEGVKQTILDYLDNDVEWSHMEAFGIPKVYDLVNKEEVKDGCIYLKGVEVEALQFYLSKAKGKGRAAAKRFLAMQEPVDAAYELRVKDNQEELTIQKKLDSYKMAFEQDIAIAETPEKEDTAG